VTIALIDDAVASGSRRASACNEVGLDARTVERWRRGGAQADGRRPQRTVPHNKLSVAERTRFIQIATRAENRDLSPNQLVPKLADEGIFIASESTLYRILRAERLLAHRGRARARTPRQPPNHAATAPGQVWSWDITYLRTTVRGQFYYLYLMMDIWSRKIVGYRVENAECTELAADLLRGALVAERKAGSPLVLHADNGSPMKGATMKATMEKLGVLASYSRPSVSNDNPFSESLFRTLKYSPEYPDKPFVTLDEARAWVASFASWYNEQHLHSGIGFMTPHDRHEGRSDAIMARRHSIYGAARRLHPERWTGSTRNWRITKIVRLNPERTSADHRACAATAA
jgi:putative transposase